MGETAESVAGWVRGSVGSIGWNCRRVKRAAFKRCVKFFRLALFFVWKIFPKENRESILKE